MDAIYIILNAEQLITELTMSLQMARQQQITRAMQGLAAGAGLLRGEAAPTGD